MPDRSRRLQHALDTLFALAAMAIAALFTTRYLMPFRLDDVLLMQWSNHHSLLDAFDPYRGQLINSFRPMYAMTAWTLTYLAGWQHPFWWHLTLVICLLIGLTFTGLTARYLVQRWYALEISTALYWLAFTAILNVFFWYSDLTFGLELAFTCPAWYFGLRGLYEGRLKYWITAMLLGSLAVLSKEPAVVLVHVVLIGSLLLERHHILATWRGPSQRDRAIAIVVYVLFAIVTIWIALSSATRTNRFFPLDTPDLGFFIRDRIAYYSGVYLSMSARILLFFPIVFAALDHWIGTRYEQNSMARFLFVTVIGAVIAILVFSNITIAVPLLVFIFVSVSVSPERKIVRRLLPFLACLVIGMATLLITVQLVKTQLTEMALLSCILASWGWSVWIEEARMAFLPTPDRMRRVIIYSIGGIELLVLIGMIPKFSREEHLLRDVRNVRADANDAVEWSAKRLPHDATLAVCLYGMHGLSAGSVTSISDSAKLRAQYTFDGGYVYEALEVLGRRDIRHAYLEDSTLLPTVLAAMRAQNNSYLFLQSQLDLDLFQRRQLLKNSDSLLARFQKGPYPAEIWLLRN